MENQDDNQEGQNDVPDSDVPEFVSRAIEDIWVVAQKEARKEFEQERENFTAAVERLRNENARLYKENRELKDELKQGKSSDQEKDVEKNK